MFGRRSYPRFTISTQATLSILRDVLVERVAGDTLFAISRQAGVVGEALTMELAESQAAALSVRVVESRPVVSDGTVRHRLTLQPAESAPESEETR